MSSFPGEYCARCAAKTILVIEHGFEVYTCPNGHGVQAITQKPEPTEIGMVQWPIAVTDTDIALVSSPTTLQVGSLFLIDSEFMTVTDISNVDNPGVARAAMGSTVATHAAGAKVEIWGN